MKTTWYYTITTKYFEYYSIVLFYFKVLIQNFLVINKYAYYKILNHLYKYLIVVWSK